MTERILHTTKYSGHGHRVELLLRMLGLPYEVADAPADLRRSDEFAALNPLQQVPVLVEDGLVLSDSNAILVYLARRYDPAGRWMPDDPVEAARVQRFLSIAAGELRYGPCAARMRVQWNVPADPDLTARIAERLLRFLDVHLADRAFLAAPHPTVADLACYAYVAHAPEGGIALAPYAAVRAWLSRVEALPGFFAMPNLPVPEQAA
jgi:glutathione S-transferase